MNNYTWHLLLLTQRAMESLSLLTLKETNGIASVTSVQRAHDLFRTVKVPDPEGFRANVTKPANATDGGQDDGDDGKSPFFAMGSSSSGSGAGGNSGKGGKITVVELFKFPKNLKDVFGSVRGQFGEHLRVSEVRDVLVMYIKNKDLDGAEAAAAAAAAASAAVAAGSDAAEDENASSGE